jgi:hypothetical protein
MSVVWETKKYQYITKTGKLMLYDTKHKVWIDVTPSPNSKDYIRIG